MQTRESSLTIVDIPSDPDRDKVVIRVLNNRAYLLCSQCQSDLWNDSSLGLDLTLFIHPNEMSDLAVMDRSREIIERLLNSWEKCNGSVNCIRCVQCRKEG